MCLGASPSPVKSQGAFLEGVRGSGPFSQGGDPAPSKQVVFGSEISSGETQGQRTKREWFREKRLIKISP
jgi:hypothetical protein